ncbi:MAG: hypothetical protein JNL82_02650 [Myxococcales bacterium]|nr:hypothetical protein [Myxococcales bacterium]
MVFTLMAACGGDEAATDPSTSETSATTSAGGSETSAGPTSGPTSEPTSAGPTSGTGETTSGSTTSGATTAGSTTGVTPETTGETGADTGGTSTGDSGDTTGDESSAGADTTGDESSTGGGDDEYAAFFVPGGLDRMVVRKRHGDLCTTMIFVWPSDQDPPGFSVGLPAMWGVQDGTIHQGADDCLQFMQFPAEPEHAVTGLGSATWAGMFCPPTLDIDITLGFAVLMPWVPDQDVLQATGIPVQGC